MKYIGLYVVIVAMISCDQSSSQYQYKDNASEVLEILLTEGIEELYDKPYHISPIFDTNFKVINLLNMKEMLSINDNDIDYMIKEYNAHKEKKLDDYLAESYRTRISSNEPSIGEIYAVIDPPMFTIDYKKCIVYLTIIKQEDKSYKWDENLFVFERNNRWELAGHFSRN